MAQWKKVIVSGSTANLANVQVDGLTANQVVIGGGTAGNLTTTAINGTGNIVATTGATVNISGSFSGSFVGDGSGLTGVTATFPVTAKTDLSTTDQFFINDGTNKYVTYGNLVTDLAGAGAGTSNLTTGDAGDSLALTSQISVTGVTASFLGNLTGTASYATQATNAYTASYVTTAQTASYVLNAISASYALNATTANTASYVTTAQTASYVLNAVSASLAANVSSIANNVTNNTNNYVLTATGGGTINGEGNLQFDGTTLTVTGNEVITGNLTVQGTASFQNTSNLEVADRFILLASGSNTGGDGGLVIQQGIQNNGQLFGYENSINRWGFTSSFDAGSPSFTAVAMVTTTETGTVSPTAAPIYGGVGVNGVGNIYVNTNTSDIFIYA